MLERAPEETLETDTATDDAVYCAACGHLLTRTRWSLDMGGFERVFINPAGRVFRLQCYREVPGAVDKGTPTDKDTWFPDYLWHFALCRGCGMHVGWRYVSELDPPVFFGLIKTALTQTPGTGQGR